ncbi:ABC transporter ATP-binding protein [Clostridium magnum]|uniref:Teichoic acids export ATP-binding protein TagH n=1 Tax=Clostridium magnum DSM 2767 TaxID=1121326 RepID=A0A162RP72_9CLOT|nr:ABC transporter ATP-binding protein [Clostridium magnum]KZL90191.1 teichoic acids export ATP-binding protein TagH [Clostridium magnum DSM 2767]SHH63934.1 lipopolysaccharide transport system ATP-binding protein [Clostridium magnum DSM 2767]
MLENISIKVENLTKTYKLYERPIDRLKEAINPMKKKYHKDFHALKNVSFEIKKGETVGIVGKNGSGKSTILKIITGILTPTSGKVTVNGKISALLELGAGFNPEFTGIENIYLNGTMMGFSRSEMDKKLSSIIEFADIGDFVKQPVKTYSSGMFVRLAFAVAINVEPDILIVDEALAVGDDMFQKKCFTKIDALKKSGKTILFVSHSGSLIIELCDRAIMLDSGENILVGRSNRVVNLYQKLLFASKDKAQMVREQIKKISLIETKVNDVSSPKTIEIKEKETACAENEEEYFDESLIPKDAVFYEKRGASIFDCKILNYKGESVNVLRFGKRYTLNYKVEFFTKCYNVRFGMLIKTKTGIELSGAATANSGEGIPSVNEGSIINVEFEFTPKLTSGVYFLRCGVVGIESDSEIFLDRQVDFIAFRMLQRTQSLMNSLVDLDINSNIYEV